MSADEELSKVLNRRQMINDSLELGEPVQKVYQVVNVYTEFHELSRKQIKEYQKTFSR